MNSSKITTNNTAVVANKQFHQKMVFADKYNDLWDDVNAISTSATVTTLTSTTANITTANVSGTLAVTNTALTAGDTHSGVTCYVTSVNPSNSYGAASYFEADISGTQAGEFVYGSGTWINTTATVGSGKYLCAQDNGIYYISGTLTGSKVIFGLRAEVPVSMAAANRVCPFSLNTNNVGITALFDCQTTTDLGIVGAGGRSVTTTYVPLLIDAGGNVRYVILYS